MKEPLVSIILPTYNGVPIIRNAILSVLWQSFSDWELIVVDDCSSQNIKEVVSETMRDKTDHLQIITNSRNLGIGGSLNEGISKATGKYIARIDDDDEWVDKEKLKKQISFLESNIDYVLVGTGAVVISDKGVEQFRYLLPQEDRAIRKKILSKNCFVHSSVVFNKDAAVECGGYGTDSGLKYVEDYNLWLNLGLIGKLYNLPECSVALMNRVGSISSTNRVKQSESAIRQVIKFRKAYPSFFSGLFVSIARFFFFTIQKLLHIDRFWELKIKPTYKKF